MFVRATRAAIVPLHPLSGYDAVFLEMRRSFSKREYNTIKKIRA
jgi:hypothetical protein